MGPRRTPSAAIVALVESTLLVAGCSAAKPVSSPPPPGATAGAVPSSSPAAGAATGSAGPVAGAQHDADAAAAELVLPADGGTGTFAGLTVTVEEIVEKRTMEGDGMMRATLRLRAGDEEQTVQITSDEPTLAWSGYELIYRGGWRQEVQLSVRRLAP